MTDLSRRTPGCVSKFGFFAAAGVMTYLRGRKLNENGLHRLTRRRLSRRRVDEPLGSNAGSLINKPVRFTGSSCARAVGQRALLVLRLLVRKPPFLVVQAIFQRRSMLTNKWSGWAPLPIAATFCAKSVR